MPQIFKPGALISELVKADLPLPTDMMERDNMDQWRTYIHHSSLARAFAKFAESTDRYQKAMDDHKDTSDFTALPLPEQERLYSYWATTAAAAYVMMDKLCHISTSSPKKEALTDIAIGLYYVAELMTAVNAPDSARWNDRLQWERNPSMQDRNHLRLISAMMQRAHNNMPQP